MLKSVLSLATIAGPATEHVLATGVPTRPAHRSQREDQELCASLRYMHLLFDLLLSSHPVDLSPTIRALDGPCGACAAPVERSKARVKQVLAQLWTVK